MLRFRLITKDGAIVADNLLPSEVFRLMKEGKVKDLFSSESRSK